MFFKKILCYLFLCSLIISFVCEDSFARKKLDIHNVGAYAIVPGIAESQEVKKGRVLDRTQDMNLGFKCIWIRTDDAVEKLDLSQLVEEINFGWNCNPKKLTIIRIDFWGNNGRERHEGTLSPISVYKKRIDAVLLQLQPVVNKLQGISLSEENILTDGRPTILRELYYYVKRQFSDLPIYQWWTPMTAVPGTYEGFFLPADGWIIDPYYHCEGYYGKAANIQRYVQKYLITGKQLIFMPYATNYTGFFNDPIKEWEVIEEQLELCKNYNLPVVWFWTYTKTNQSGGTAYFSHPTGDKLMDRISERVFKWSDYVKSLPEDFDGNPEIAERWENPSVHRKIIPGDSILKDGFSQSYFLDQSSGTGFRDIVWDGQVISARGYNGRKTKVEIIYKITSDFPMQWPYVTLDVNVKPSLNGAVKISISKNSDQNWSHEISSIPVFHKQELKLDTRPDKEFKETKAIFVKLELTGDAGTDENFPVKVDNLNIMNMW